MTKYKNKDAIALETVWTCFLKTIESDYKNKKKGNTIHIYGAIINTIHLYTYSYDNNHEVKLVQESICSDRKQCTSIFVRRSINFYTSVPVASFLHNVFE